jgi:hypothetical protein
LPVLHDGGLLSGLERLPYRLGEGPSARSRRSRSGKRTVALPKRNPARDTRIDDAPKVLGLGKSRSQGPPLDIRVVPWKPSGGCGQSPRTRHSKPGSPIKMHND